MNPNVRLNRQLQDAIISVANMQYNYNVNWNNVTDIIINFEGVKVKFNNNNKWLTLYYKELM